MINISGAPPNSLIVTPPPGYYDNYSGPANPACFLTLDSAIKRAGQSFTPTFKYNLKGVDLWLKKGPGANVGNIATKLYAVDGNGHPTGAALNYGVILQNDDFLEDYSWVFFALTDMRITAHKLGADTKYCIVVNGSSLDVANPLFWACGGDGSGYPNGDQEWSINSGDTWSTDTTRDQLFRCYHTPWLDNYSGYSSPFSGVNLNSALRWFGQSFTAMKSYPLNRIDIHISKGLGDFVGDILVGFYNVDMFGHPFGVALATGTIPDANVSTEKAWVKCWMSEYNIAIDEKYCIVVHGNSLDEENQLVWDWDEYFGDSDYAGGDMESSLDGGETWNTVTDKDLLFRCYPK